MIDIYNASLADILPESLKIDSQFVAIAKALNPILQKIAADTRNVIHLPRLDELEGTILDVLAEQFHVDFFDSVTLDDDQKKNLIRNSIALHRLKGTVWSVEYIVNQFFHNATVEELGGFLFKINTDGYTATPEAFDTFCRMLMDVKPVRSWLVGVDLDLSP
ncbi:MAG: phage tail protein, partial [Selenomonadaceae bacterium]|nr:phage tail protein [Selenomonadaceae bacterium]